MSTITEIRAAATRLEGITRRTPLLTSPFLDEIAGRRVLIKPECLQHTGSFKYRGASNAIRAMDPAVRARGVIAFSSGNHAQGVALAAAEMGVPSVIIMPATAPQLKIDNTRALGGEVVLYDREGGEDRDEIGGRLAAERGLTLVKPYDDPMVIAGQGTTGLEIAAQLAERGVQEAEVAVCAGGGGLASGIALALEADAPGTRIRPCEPEGFDDLTRSLVSGQRETNAALGGSICDAIITPSPGEITFPILKRLAGPGIVVSDADALRAMQAAFLRLKLVAEPGGAVALAAALFKPEAFEADTVVAVVTGGNVDPEMFARALAL
ncbi:MAG: threonine/serine dehydratase [Pseudomonadota bacterium]